MPANQIGFARARPQAPAGQAANRTISAGRETRGLSKEAQAAILRPTMPATNQPAAPPQLKRPYKPQRDKRGRLLPGWSGNPGGDPGRARRELNADTIREMHAAFRRGGQKAINQVMKTQPAIFLKLLVLLVPRELEVTHSAGVKGLSDEQIEQAIEAIQDMLARREAKTIDVTPRTTKDGG